MGDILGVENLTVQCKNYKDVATGIHHAIDGAESQMETSGNRWCIGLVKNRRKPIQKTYAVMSLHMFLDLYKFYRQALAELEELKNQLENNKKDSNNNE